MVKPTNITSDYHEEERLTCVLVLDSFNSFINEIVSHTTLPLCLWPVDGQPLLDYIIHTLIRSGIQEIILLATSNSYEIRSYLMNSQWLRTYPKLIRLIPCKEARSLGDCLKDLEQENIINNHFLLLYGNGTLLTNEKLNNLFQIHKENIKKDKNCVMTLVYRQLDSNHFQHPSYTDDQHLYIIHDANTHRLYDYAKEYLDTYKIPLDLLEKPDVTVETLYCPLDCHLAVCSPDVLHLFKDNFDFSTINEFVKGVLRDDIAGHTIYTYLYETGYFLSVHNLRLYMKATFDILRRWSYPLVPEIMTSMHKQTLSTITTTPSSPQIKLNDPYLSFYNIFYPIIYDKHNIYKQGDIQLDRLSNIQQDIFIGHKTQILSGVCLRSSLIGQNCIIGKNTQIENSILWNHVRIGDNCIIKNSIICDNVLIRDNVQIDKECILCKGVIIGTNIHLNEHHTIISSNSTTSSSSVIDEIEIDDDIQLTPENFKRSNSKLNRSSTRSSDKSFSDKSICSSVEETITSNSDLVGIDGLGTELIFTSGHDDQIKTFEHTDDDDDDDEDDNDKKQLNAFDAWGYRREPIENNDIFIEFEIENQSYRNSMMKTSPNQPQNIESGSTTPDINKSLSSSTETSSVISGPNDVSEFQDEVIRTLKRAYTQKLKIENIIVELNMLKPTYDVSPTEFDQSITRAVFLLPFENKIANTEKPNYINTLKLTLDQLTQFILKNYMKTTNEQAQMTLLNELDLICLKHIQPIGERIVNILDYLYDKDVLDEQWILKWYKNKQDKIEKNEILIKPEDKIYYDKLKEFIQWLQNAESDDDDDED